MPDPEDYKTIIDIIRILGPTLKKMAEETGKPHNFFIVELIIRLIGEEKT